MKLNKQLETIVRERRREGERERMTHKALHIKHIL